MQAARDIISTKIGPRSLVRGHDDVIDIIASCLLGECPCCAGKGCELCKGEGKLGKRWPVLLEAEDPRVFLGDGWRYRVRRLTFNPNVVVGHLSRGQFVEMVGATLFDTHAQLQAQQANGEWVAIAWTMEARELRKRKRHRTGQGSDERWQPHGPPNPQDSVEEDIPEDAYVLVVVWVDVSRRPELDNWEMRTGRSDGVMSGGRIPPKLRDEYAAARAIIAKRAAEEHGTVKLAPPPLLSEADTAAALELLGTGVQWTLLERVYRVPVDKLKAYLEPLLEPKAPAEPKAEGKKK